MIACFCCSGKPYADCCGQLHNGAKNADSAEALMRSRYSAYVAGLEDYLLTSWHASTRPVKLNLAEDAATNWLGLDVKRACQIDDKHATVEFVARYRLAGRGHRLHEISNFVQEDGRWYYVDGEIKR